MVTLAPASASAMPVTPARSSLLRHQAFLKQQAMPCRCCTCQPVATADRKRFSKLVKTYSGHDGWSMLGVEQTHWHHEPVQTQLMCCLQWPTHVKAHLFHSPAPAPGHHSTDRTEGASTASQPTQRRSATQPAQHCQDVQPWWSVLHTVNHLLVMLRTACKAVHTTSRCASSLYLQTLTRSTYQLPCNVM